MEIARDLVGVIGFAGVVVFFWIALIAGFRSKKDYEKEATIKNGVIISKSFSITRSGIFSGRLYELQIMTDDGEKYNVKSLSFRVRFYKEGKQVKIIVPNDLGTSDLPDGSVCYKNQSILEIEQEKSFILVLGVLVTVLFTVLLVVGIIGFIAELVEAI